MIEQRKVFGHWSRRESRLCRSYKDMVLYPVDLSPLSGMSDTNSSQGRVTQAAVKEIHGSMGQMVSLESDLLRGEAMIDKKMTKL